MLSVTEKPIIFPNQKGEKLWGVLHLPKIAGESGKTPCVIVCHGYNQNKLFRFLVFLSRALAENGFAAFRFDFAGCGESEGKLGDTSITKQVGELETAYDLLLKRPDIDEEKIVFAGHSLGALITLLLHVKLKSENPLVLLVPALNQKELIPTWYSEEQIQTCLEQGYIDTIKGRIGASYIKEAINRDWLEEASLVKGASLIIHGTRDDDVPLAYTKEVFSKLPEPKKIEVIQDTDYKFRNCKHQEMLASAVLDWLKECL